MLPICSDRFAVCCPARLAVTPMTIRHGFEFVEVMLDCVTPYSPFPAQAISRMGVLRDRIPQQTSGKTSSKSACVSKASSLTPHSCKPLKTGFADFAFRIVSRPSAWQPPAKCRIFVTAAVESAYSADPNDQQACWRHCWRSYAASESSAEGNICARRHFFQEEKAGTRFAAR